ncbi:MAG: hypothetical protein PHU61_01335 [Candidatus Absconditabacteria bacterium]|nr:hypothetical protein [Candidatus Absconditabacteria bacterium]MDD3868057.1 hypothetical protein [Candidatus Absconditabacteria bacterium]
MNKIFIKASKSMIFGNLEAAKTLKTYISNKIETGKGVQFFLLVGPEGIGKSAHAQELIKEFLGGYGYSDFLYLQDYSYQMGKNHNIPIELNSSNSTIEFQEGSKRENFGIRETNLRLQQSGFSGKKFVLIENMQRMLGPAMNAFLKTVEEPLKDRFILATVPHQSMLLDTIVSRAIVIHFDPLSISEMQQFAQQEQIGTTDKELQDILIAMAMGKPGMLLKMHQQLTLNPEFADTLKSLIQLLPNPHAPLNKKRQLLKKLSEIGLIDAFIDGRIAYASQHNHFLNAEKRLNTKKLMQANVNQENVLLYGLLD